MCRKCQHALASRPIPSAWKMRMPCGPLAYLGTAKEHFVSCPVAARCPIETSKFAWRALGSLQPWQPSTALPRLDGARKVWHSRVLALSRPSTGSCCIHPAYQHIVALAARNFCNSMLLAFAWLDCGQWPQGSFVFVVDIIAMVMSLIIDYCFYCMNYTAFLLTSSLPLLWCSGREL